VPVFESIPSFRCKLHAFRLSRMDEIRVFYRFFPLSFSLVRSTLPVDDLQWPVMIGIILLVQIFAILIPAWNVRLPKATGMHAFYFYALLYNHISYIVYRISPV
jgi:hypothetical protein